MLLHGPISMCRMLQSSASCVWLAGRVQSVALRLVTERESEIGAFQPQTYFSVDVILETEQGSSFPARLSIVSFFFIWIQNFESLK